MARRLNLTRNQLATFCKDFEQIRQFELLFAEVNKLVDASDAENLAALAPPVVEQVVTSIQTIIEAIEPTPRENNSVKTDYIDLNTTAPAPFAKPARLWWDDGEKTAVMTLGGGNVTLHMGQEEYQDCYNGTGGLLSKGTVVQVTGAQGQRVRIAKAQANAEATSVHTLGFTTEAIASGAEGFVTNSGLIRGINTTVDSEGNPLAAGDTLYLSTSVAGGFTKVKPSAPNHLVIVGFVVRVHASSGSIFVKVDNGYELDELHNVKITNPVPTGSLLFYDAALGYWKNLLLTVNATASDVLNVSGNEIGGNDTTGQLITEAGDNIVQENGDLILADGGIEDAIVFWDDSNSKLTYLTTGPNLSITGTTLDLADMPEERIKGRAIGAGTGSPQDLTGTQATAILDTFTSSLKGLAPASGGGMSNYLRADGTWNPPPGTQDPVTIAATASDVLNVTGQAIGGVDINADKMVFWDDSDGKLTYLTPGTNLSISGTSLNASVPSIPNNFGTIAVTGQSNVVADTTSDTLTLAASNMVAITTNATTDTVTIDVPLLSGDVTTTSAGVATISANAVDTTELNNQAVTYSKFQNVTGPKFIGRQTASSGSVTDLDMATARAMIGTANTTTTGLVPVLPNVVTSFLNGQGTFSSPIGTGGLIAVTVYDTSSGGAYQTFSAINSATKTMLVELVGGGGGGRSATAASGEVVAGGGGAAGGYAYWFGARVVGATYSYMVGGGGGANTAGTDSNFRQDPSTVLATAKGGNPGGAAMASGTQVATGVGGDGGTGGTGTKSYTGAGGGGALRLSGTVGLSGYGASSIFGGGGKGVGAGTAGVAGGAPGAGGSGGCSNSATTQAGGAGSDGMVRIWEFY